jgi:hypothetical protein
MFLEVYSYDAKEEKSELIGSGKIKMEPENMEKRSAIKDAKNA